MPHTFCQSCESCRNCGADPMVRAGTPRPAFRQRNQHHPHCGEPTGASAADRGPPHNQCRLCGTGKSMRHWASAAWKAASRRDSQLPPEEIDRRMVTAQPGGMPQEAVDLVGQDELLEIHTLLAERIRERDGLAEVDVAIVVAVNHQHRGAPTVEPTASLGPTLAP